jgi:hypothetical protein
MKLKQLKPSRTKPCAGDIFAMRLPDDGNLFGRVISTEAKAGWALSGSILIYIYSHRSGVSAAPTAGQLTLADLLIPPLMTNKLPWSKGYFETVGHRPLLNEDVLKTHCFKSSSGKLYDEKCAELGKETKPCGQWGLHSYRTIDYAVSAALDIRLAEQ